MNTQTIQIANRFSALIREWLTATELAYVVATNACNPDYCATHDYCDPNEAMIQAFAEVVGRDLDPIADEAAINAAWAAARAAEFQDIDQEADACAALFMEQAPQPQGFPLRDYQVAMIEEIKKQHSISMDMPAKAVFTINN